VAASPSPPKFAPIAGTGDCLSSVFVHVGVTIGALASKTIDAD
jgi:hypothetical protein